MPAKKRTIKARIEGLSEVQIAYLLGWEVPPHNWEVWELNSHPDKRRELWNRYRTELEQIRKEAEQPSE